MKRIALFSVVMIFAAGLAFGADSKTNRATKTVGISVGTGIHPASLIAPPIGLDYIASENWTFGAEFGSASASVKDSGDEAKVDYSNMGIRARWFPNTNSFNLGFALNQRTLTGSATASATDSTSGAVATAKGTIDTSATVGAILIGNQWTMDFGLTIGVDWLVLSGAIASATTAKVSGSVAGVPLTTSQTADAQKSLDDLGKIVNAVSSFPGFLVVSLGWSF